MENEIVIGRGKFSDLPIDHIFYLEKECYWEFKKTSNTTAHNNKHGELTFNLNDQVYIQIILL